MLLTIVLALFLSLCNGDVSHVDTDFRDDGYHYNRPEKQFPGENNGLDNQLDTHGLQTNSGIQEPDISQAKANKPEKPNSEYLPPDNVQAKPEPSTFPQTRTQTTYPSRDYTPINVLTKSPERQQPSKPPSTPQPAQVLENMRSTYSPRSQTPSQQTKPGPSMTPREPINEYVPPPTATSEQRPKQTQRPITSIPEREYLPPAAANEIDSGRESDQTNGTPQSSIPVSQSTYSAPKQETDQPKLPESTGGRHQTSFTAPQSTYYTPQTTYTRPTSPEINPTHFAPQTTSPVPQSHISVNQPMYTRPKLEPSYTAPQTTYNAVQSTVPSSESQPQEPQAAHELGPDGYKYKIPSKSFKS